MSTPNELRVFISSTFRDLQEEREHLVKKIFPEIRALCRERGITFTEIDLRWGLTDEEVVLGQVIRTCLEEIDKCRPYFIGLVGERYGWAPPLPEYYKDPDLFKNWPWLEDAAMEGSSITDIEFRHGALNDPSAAGHSRFYVRRQRRSLADTSRTAELDEERVKLEDLKDRVRRTGLTVEEFRDPVSLGELIYDELIEIIERDFSDARTPTPLELERSRHAAFAASRRRAYIPNAEYLTRLNNWLTGDDARPVVLYAESGSGKSSLLSFWCEQLRRRHPDLHVLEHYVGIGAGDSDHLGIIRHVIEEIKVRYERSEEIPSRPEELERAFANWLGFNVGTPMLLVLDGINQLSGRALDLHWLPPAMPEGIRLVISSTVETTLVDLRTRGWIELGMQPLSEAEREAVVVRFLAEYGKALSPGQVKRIAADVKCAHPLFLRTLLEELRLQGVHEHLELALDKLLLTTGTEDLFQQVLERLEDDYGTKSVREVLTLIFASRSGLSEDDIEIVTGISRLKLSTLLLGLDYHLVRRDGLLSFFHDYLRRAVEKRYLIDQHKRREPSERLAAHFRSLLPTLQTSLELLHALETLHDQDSLEDVLTDISHFELLWFGERDTVLRLWSACDRKRVADAYRPMVDSLSTSVDANRRIVLLTAVAALQEMVGNWSEAQIVLREILELLRTTGERASEPKVLFTLSRLAESEGRMDEAESLARQAEAIARECGDLVAVASAVGNRGIVHSTRGEYREALACYREQEDISRKIGSRAGIALAVGNRGIVHSHRGESDEALACYREQERIAREDGDRRQVAISVGNRGEIHFDRGEEAEALACYQEQERIARELGDRRTLTAAVGNLGVLHKIRGESAEALECYLEGERISDELGDRLGAAIAVGNRGSIHGDRKQYSEALECFRRAEQEHRAIGFRHGLTYWLTGSAWVLLEIVSTGGVMPEYLTGYVPDARTEFWVAPTLRMARQQVEEAIAISDDLSKPDTRCGARVLLARIVAAEGSMESAMSMLTTMLEEFADDNDQADVHYWLWKLNPTARNHGADALRLYQALYIRSPRHEDSLRIEELRAAIEPSAPVGTSRSQD